MKVRATQMGYYGHKRRREGDVFEIDPPWEVKQPDGTVKRYDPFSSRWMEKINDEREVIKDIPKEEKPKPTGDQDVL